MKEVNASCCLMPFGFVFMLMGGVVFWFMLNEVRTIYESQSWEEVMIDLRSVEVQFPEKPPSGGRHDIYELAVKYDYEYGGRTYTSTKARRNSFSSDSYHVIALKRKELLNSFDGLSCYVNPDDPSEAILEKDSLWFGLVLILPLTFMLVGFVLFVAVLPIWGWLHSASSRESDSDPNFDRESRFGSSNARRDR